MDLATARQVTLVVVLWSFVTTSNCVTMDISKYQHNLLKEHNEFRKLERASNMHLLKWNNSIANQAASWVERCDFKHEMSGGVGENLAFDSNPGDPWDIMKSSVNSWHDEKREWRYGKGACGHACHYTQMVWATTKQMGCAAKRCTNLNAFGRNIKNALYLVCYYYPRGNWIGEYPYSPGAPCSKCDKGCTCSDSLCDESGHDTSNVIQTVQAPAAAPIAYYRRTELHSSQSKAPLKSLGVVQRGQSHSWQWSSKGDSKVQYSPQVQTQWQTRTVYHKKPVSLRALSGGERQSRGHVIRSDARSSSRCIDRLPSCRAWHRQCKTSRVVQLSCLKTCNRCDSVHQIISYDHSKRSKPTTNNAKERNRAKQLRHRPNHRGTIQRQRAAADGGTSPSRHRRRHRRIGASQPGTKLKPKPDRRRAFNEVAKYRGQRMRYGGRISTSGQNRMFRARKVQTRRRQSPRRRQSSRNKSTCSDDDKYSDRCTYWHRSGYCAENQMMRDVFCRKTCGGC